MFLIWYPFYTVSLWFVKVAINWNWWGCGQFRWLIWNPQGCFLPVSPGLQIQVPSLVGSDPKPEIQWKSRTFWKVIPPLDLPGWLPSNTLRHLLFARWLWWRCDAPSALWKTTWILLEGRDSAFCRCSRCVDSEIKWGSFQFPGPRVFLCFCRTALNPHPVVLKYFQINQNGVTFLGMSSASSVWNSPWHPVAA